MAKKEIEKVDQEITESVEKNQQSIQSQTNQTVESSSQIIENQVNQSSTTEEPDNNKNENIQQ